MKLSSGQKTPCAQEGEQSRLQSRISFARQQSRPPREEAKRMVLEQKLREQAAELDRERELLLGSEFRFAIKEPLMEMGSEEYEFVDGLWKAQFGPDDGFAEVVGHYPKGVDEKIRVLLLLRNGEKVGARTIIEVCEGQFLVENFALIDGSQGLGYSTVFTELMIKKVRAESPGAMMSIVSCRQEHICRRACRLYTCGRPSAWENAQVPRRCDGRWGEHDRFYFEGRATLHGHAMTVPVAWRFFKI